MSDYYIGLSGLNAAQWAFDVIGNNIANAATDGYHRQRLELSPAFLKFSGTDLFTGGVNVEGVTRLIDTALEQEIIMQQSILGSLSQEAATMATVETTFGEFSTEEGSLNAVIDSFFTSLQNLSANPADKIWQHQVVSDAEAMAGKFRSLGEFLNEMQVQIKFQAERTVDNINTLTGQIAELNSQIERLMMVGGEANNMRDQRDQLISELSELVGFQMTQRENGIVDINSGGIPLVTGAASSILEVGYTNDGKLGLSIEGANNYVTNIQGGTVGGLFSLGNEFVADVSDNLDLLANAIMKEINDYHVMGMGSTGSFTQLIGQGLISQDLSNIENVSSGTVYIRVTNTSTNEVTRQAIAIDADNDTLSDVATAISAITGLSAGVNSSNQLTITADPNYEFDFLPCVLSEPTTTDFDDASPPTVSVTGIYDGTVNDTFEFKVIGDGAVGNDTLQLEVRDGAGGGDLITTVNIGSGYAAGDWIEIGNGIKIALSMGNLAESDGDLFTVEAFADTDTSGILTAAGLNTFFVGASAVDMGVNQRITEDPQSIATGIGADAVDNRNIERMAAIKDENLDTLGALTCGDFYRKLSSDIGQHLSVKQMQEENIEIVILNLNDRRSDISGVDINEEAAQLLLFEQMFQAISEYMNTLNRSLSNLMDII